MIQTFDVIVAGVGGMGAQTCLRLAERGHRVLGLERFDIPHTFGSSHAVNRIIRLAYFEHPSYVPLLRRAYDLWRDLESRAGEQLLFITGSMDIGPTGSAVVEGSLASCRKHDLPHELLDPTEVISPPATKPCSRAMAASLPPSEPSSRPSISRWPTAPSSAPENR
jgi:sarcosine oxidase